MLRNDCVDALLIDDDSDYFVLVRSLLEVRQPERWRVRWANTLDQALEAIRTKTPDVILLDHRLGPSTTGLALVPLLLEAAPGATVLYLTGYGRKVGAAAIAAGAHGWIDKGQVSTETLEREIDGALSRRVDEEPSPDRLRAFLATLVDGLGNPTTMVRATLQDLCDATHAIEPEDLEEALEQVEQVSCVLDALGVVAYPDRTRLAGLSLNDALAEAQRSAERRSGAHRVVVLGNALRVVGHRPSLVYVLTELLTNAFEAAPGRAVTIRVTPRKGSVRIQVEDQGPGSPDWSHAADRWTSSKGADHAGLGLHFSKILMDAMGGRFGLAASGEGSTAFLELPAASDTLPRLLIVDDEPMMLATLQRALVGSYDITTASDLATGRAALERETFDLVLSDIVMPDGSGLDLYTWVVEHRPELARRFVFMTGHARDSRAAGMFRRTALPVVAKPFKLAELRRVLAGLIREDG